MLDKLTRKSLKAHFNTTLSPLEVVHGDLVGPILPFSRSVARYFLTLVDQHTGYISVTVMKEKSNATKAIEQFEAFHKTQTSHRIKKMITK